MDDLNGLPDSFALYVGSKEDDLGLSAFSDPATGGNLGNNLGKDDGLRVSYGVLEPPGVSLGGVASDWLSSDISGVAQGVRFRSCLRLIKPLRFRSPVVLKSTLPSFCLIVVEELFNLCFIISKIRNLPIFVPLL